MYAAQCGSQGALYSGAGGAVFEYMGAKPYLTAWKHSPEIGTTDLISRLGSDRVDETCPDLFASLCQACTNAPLL